MNEDESQKSSPIPIEKEDIKKTVMNQIKALKPPPNATPDQAIECLVKQAEFYTNFLLSKHEAMNSKRKQQEADKEKIENDRQKRKQSSKQRQSRAPSQSQQIPSQEKQHHMTESAKKNRRRGHFDSQDSEVHHIISEEQHIQEQQTFTRLTKQPSILVGGQLKYYQLVALNWMISLYESGINGILADDMGLGKTIQTISIISFIKEYKKVKGPHIVIAPKITLGNWENEFRKWLPCAKVVKLIATKQEREQILQNSVSTGNFDIIVTSFEGVRICLPHLKKIKWHYVVIDEAHKIKNEESQLSQVVRKLNTQCKLLLTGTPLQNNLHELWSLLNFLLPEIFSSSEMFDMWFNAVSEKNDETEQQIEKRNVHMIGQLHKILKPFMLRRTKLEVEKTLPPKKQVHIFVGLTDLQIKLYKNLLQNRNASQDDKKHYLNLLMQLRKACNHPYLFEDIEPADAPQLGEHLVESCGKLIVLDQLLKKLKAEGGHQVLIFSQMTMVLNILEDFCNLREYQYCRIDGSTDMESRDEQIESFMKEDSEQFIFLLSTRAGGLGINLTAADTVIIYDSDWNPQMDLQAMDRAHRIGQKKPVMVYRLITQDTVEVKIIERQTIKLKWDQLVIQQAKNTQKNKALTKEEMKEMLHFGASVTLKASKGTISDEEIDAILKRGEDRTNKMNKEVEDKLTNQQSSLTDFSMNSINIFDFMQQDEKKKREDAEALDEAMAKEIMQNDVRTRREKGKNVNYAMDSKNVKYEQLKKEKKVSLPDYHFYENKDVLLDLLQKEEDHEWYRTTSEADSYPPLNEQEEALKEELQKTGWTDWSKTDFNNFISASEKYLKDNFKEICRIVGKPIEEVKKYAEVFWSRIDELSDKDRILKQIQAGEDRIESRKTNYRLLEWKASRSYSMEFNPTIYTKFKSKLYSIEADRFIATNIYKLGLKNMAMVRAKIKDQPMFRFDHFLNSRTESELNKRLQSILKLIEKEKDNEEFGLDYDVGKDSKKKQKKKKQDSKELKNDENGQKKAQGDVVEIEDDSDKEEDEEVIEQKPKKKRKILITDFVAKGKDDSL